MPFGKAVKLLKSRRKGSKGTVSRARGLSKQASLSKSPRPVVVQAQPSMTPRSTAVQAPLSMSPRPTAVQAPLRMSPRPTAIQAPLPMSPRRTAIQAPLSMCQRPTALQVPLSMSPRPTMVQGDLLETPRAPSLRMRNRRDDESSTCCAPPPFAPWIPPPLDCSEIEQKGDGDEPDFAINTPTGSEFEALVSSRWESGFDTARSSSGGHHGPGPSCLPPWQGLHWQNQLRRTLLNVTEPLPAARQEGPGRPAPEVRPFCVTTAAAKAFLATEPERQIYVAAVHARAAAGEAGGRGAISRDCPTAAEMPLPSRGSALHRLGTCRPCAFVHQEGCRSGANCEFCHMCDAGARRRLRRERLRRARAARAAAR